MARNLEEYLQENPNLKLGAADIALGRQNFGALQNIVQARQDWANATTQEERDTAHNRAENIRKAFGNYSGGADGMEGNYSPTYVKPTEAANNSNVDALFNKFNSVWQNPAPTYTPKYQREIAGLLSDLGNRDPFEYNMKNDSMYQQYRDQYVREGQKAMKDTAAQAAALTGGYGSTYGAIAAQQGYDNYLEKLNDRVPQLEQMAYSRYADDIADKFNMIGAYQNEDNRQYQQYLDALNQYNLDRNYTYGLMQDAINQNNYENQFDRSLFESDRGYAFDRDQNDFANAMNVGDYEKLRNMGYDTSYLDFMQQVEKAKGNYTLAQLQAQMAALNSAGAVSSGAKSSGGNKKKVSKAGNNNPKSSSVNWKVQSAPTQGYLTLKNLYRTYGNTPAFDKLVNAQIAAGNVTKSEYERFEKER